MGLGWRRLQHLQGNHTSNRVRQATVTVDGQLMLSQIVCRLSSCCGQPTHLFFQGSGKSDNTRMWENSLVVVWLVFVTLFLLVGCRTEDAGTMLNRITLEPKDTLLLHSQKPFIFEPRPEFVLLAGAEDEPFWIVYNAFTKRFLMFNAQGYFVRTIGEPRNDSLGYFSCSSFVVKDGELVIADYAKAKIMWFDTIGTLARTIGCRRLNYLDIAERHGRIFAYSPVQDSPLPTVFIYNSEGSVLFSGIEPEKIVQDSTWAFVPTLSLLAVSDAGEMYFSNPLYYNVHLVSATGSMVKTFDRRENPNYTQIRSIPYRRNPRRKDFEQVFDSRHTEVDCIEIFKDLLFVSVVTKEHGKAASRWLDIYTMTGAFVSSTPISSNLRLADATDRSLVFVDNQPTSLTPSKVTLHRYDILLERKSR
jgi:hypothetical protein